MIKNHSKRYLFLLIGVFGGAFSEMTIAACIPENGSQENTPNGSAYIQNTTIDCSGIVQLTNVVGNSTYAIGNVQISKETSQIIRWQNLPNTAGFEVAINVGQEAQLSAQGLDKGALLIHSGFFTKNGAGIQVVNNFFNSENLMSAKILNNGVVNYYNPNSVENNDKNKSAAIVIEGNAGPLNQKIENNGVVLSESAWGVVSSGVSVIDIYDSSNNFVRQDIAKIDDYKYSLGNIVEIVNNGSIVQNKGEVEAGDLYDGHSAAVAIFQPMVKSVIILNNSSGVIEGKFSGVDLLTNRTSGDSLLDNYGSIIGGSRGVSITKAGISDLIGYDPYFDMIVNRENSTIKGAQAGIFNEGTIGVIENYGEIKGDSSSIDTRGGDISRSINNYGLLKGDVFLGSNQLNIINSEQAAAALPRVEGDIQGDSQSVIRIVKSKVPTQFQTAGNANVGTIYIDADSQITLADGALWRAFENPILNQGAVRLATDAVSASLSGGFGNQGAINLGCINCKEQRLLIDGDYKGEVGAAVLSLYTKLGADDSETDSLTVNGHVSGTTLVNINNKKGLGDKTEKGIEVINALSSDAQAFQQSGRIVAGAYDYVLQQGDEQGANLQSWYLVSHLIRNDSEPIYRPEIGSYLANLEAANNMFNMRLTDRQGEARGLRGGGFDTDKNKGNIWMRATGSKNKFNEDSGSLNTKINKHLIQMGRDIYHFQGSDAGVWKFGLMGGYGHASSDTRSRITGNSSSSKLNGYSVGAYGTWLENEAMQGGSYMDTWVLANHFKSEVKGGGLARENYKHKGLSASWEGGYKVEVHDSVRYKYWLTPQAQVIWSNVKFNEIFDQTETLIRNKQRNNLQLRLGLRGSVDLKDDFGINFFKSFAEINLIHNVKKYEVSLNDERFHQLGNKNVGEFKLGMESGFSKQSSGWIDLSKQWGSHGFSDFKLNFGIEYKFY